MNKNFTECLDAVIRLVNRHADESQRTQQVLEETTLTVGETRETVGSWTAGDEYQDEEVQGDEERPVTQQDTPQDLPETLSSSPGLSLVGSASTVIISLLKLLAMKGSKRLVVRDQHLFPLEELSL